MLPRDGARMAGVREQRRREEDAREDVLALRDPRDRLGPAAVEREQRPRTRSARARRSAPRARGRGAPPERGAARLTRWCCPASSSNHSTSSACEQPGQRVPVVLVARARERPADARGQSSAMCGLSRTYPGRRPNSTRRCAYREERAEREQQRETERARAEERSRPSSVPSQRSASYVGLARASVVAPPPGRQHASSARLGAAARLGHLTRIAGTDTSGSSSAASIADRRKWP